VALWLADCRDCGIRSIRGSYRQTCIHGMATVPQCLGFYIGRTRTHQTSLMIGKFRRLASLPIRELADPPSRSPSLYFFSQPLI
jgi:hypothetical protein